MQIPVETGPADVQGGQAPEIAPQPDVESPGEIGDDIFAQIYNEHQGPAVPAPTPTAEGGEQHPEEEARTTAMEVNLGEDAPIETDVKADPRVDQMQATLAAMQQQLQQLTVGGQPKQPTNNPPESISVEQQVQQLMPDAKPEVAQRFAKVVKVVSDAIYAPQIRELAGAVEVLSQEANTNRAKSHTKDFSDKLDHLLTLNKVTDAHQRQNVKDAVLGRGWTVHGQKFDLQHVPLIFREVLSGQRRFNHAQQETVIDEKERDMETTPPVQTGTSTATGLKGLRDKVRDPGNRGMDFNGDEFNGIVGDFLDSTSNLANRVLGQE